MSTSGESRAAFVCNCDGNPAGGVCGYPDCQMEPPTTEELLGNQSASSGERTPLFQSRDFVAAMRASNSEFAGDAKTELLALGADPADAFKDGLAAAAIYREHGIGYDLAVTTGYLSGLAMGLRLLTLRLRECERALAETTGERDELHAAIQAYFDIERPVNASAYWTRPDGDLRRAIGA